MYRTRNLVARLFRLPRLYRRHMDRSLTPLGLSQATALPVMLLGRLGDGTRPGVLADELGVEGPSLARILDQLVRSGLIERHPDPTDGRAKTLHLTAAGRALAEQAEMIMAVIREKLFAGIADEDIDTTIRVLTRMEEALNAADMTPLGQ
ncbi:MarR family transcriptional regulator [Sphingomonas oleivorans]|uniref:MarR family transcriptional regulator n=1 Tax=Sphingomonas oleivorans TaxID=1735121 RepID=A0A2T5FXM5_9SPHN|nr:MarR family transcriptional regulator [Sphingomonas oleivorans]PTQ10879.1 MarR family transcriptional regulator [Sphingomonas oleivorans]